MKYYSLDNILKMNAHYNLIYGERSNGKSFAVWDYALKNYCEKGEKFAVIRRMEEDFRGHRALQMAGGMVKEKRVEKYSKGMWDRIYYRSHQWFLANEDNIDTCPFAYAFSLTGMEHDKSTTYAGVTTILFDEMLTRSFYLPDEFVLLMNTISTIVRVDAKTKIFMLGNTVDRYCPYFEEFGIQSSRGKPEGTIDLYEYGTSGLRLACEHTCSTSKRGGKPSDVYFAFDNPKLKMITDGEWEMELYPHLPCKYIPRDCQFKFYIEHRQELCECEIISNREGDFLYIHRKTSPLKELENDLIFSKSNRQKASIYRRTNPLKPFDRVGERIKWFFDTEKVFYQTNEIGELVRSFLQEVNKGSI